MNLLQQRGKSLVSLSASLIFIFNFSGCSKNDQDLANSNKAHLMKELIIKNAQCEIFGVRLSKSLLNNDELVNIYNDAMKARCIKKGV